MYGASIQAAAVLCAAGCAMTYDDELVAGDDDDDGDGDGDGDDDARQDGRPPVAPPPPPGPSVEELTAAAAAAVRELPCACEENRPLVAALYEVAKGGDER